MKKKFSFFKLHQNLSKLHNSEMNSTKAGITCGCSCWAASTGGSSRADNGSTNLEGGLWSDRGTHFDSYVVQ